MKDLAAAAKDHNNDETIAQGKQVRDLYPDYIYDANAYEFLAQAYEATGDKKQAAATLTDYEKRGGHDPEMLKELAALESELGDPTQAAATFDRIDSRNSSTAG